MRGRLLIAALAAAVSVVGMPIAGQAKPTGDVADMTRWSVDHVVIVVPSLPEAVAQYRAAGFTVRLGGTPAGGFDRNALIAFRDGTYLELYAPVDPASFQDLAALVASGTWDEAMRGADPMTRRFARHVADGPGLADVAITRSGLIGQMSTECAALRQSAIPCKGPVNMSRERLDGRTVRWEVDVIPSRSMPFLIADVTARHLRVPSGAAREHPNGATGIASVTMSGPDPGAISRNLAILLDTKPIRTPSAVAEFTLPHVAGTGGTTSLRVGASAQRGPTHLILTSLNTAPHRVVPGGVAITLLPS